MAQPSPFKTPPPSLRQLGWWLLVIALFGCKPEKLDPTSAPRVIDSAYTQAEHQKALITKGLTKFVPPLAHSPEFDQLANAYERKYFLLPDFSVAIHPGTEADSMALSLTTGRLQAYNGGEWGGGLFYTTPDGAMATLLRDNVYHLFVHQRRLLVLTGVDHLGMVAGTLVEIKQAGTRLEIAREISLSGKPDAMAVFRDSVFVATSGGVDVYANQDIANLLKNPYWGRLHPQTMQVNAKYIFLGANGCVIVIHRLRSQIELFR